MSTPVISVEGLGKRYYLSHQKRQDTLRDSLSHGFRGLVRRLSGGGKAAEGGREEFWALRDVAFAINQGDVVGVIGRNGAGKSTLLKILSRITEPTAGRAKIRGRIASLLEVGTGFHPELSGRENIFLNGAILGMSRVEIRRKFDEIVAFAEVERFLDTQVKHYSSGMYVRLAFAVAAHLEPEILIVDEVLAVGDIAFQKKCLGKMNEVATQAGRTVLFVSHNLDAIRQLCRTGIHLQDGRVVEHDTITRILPAYIAGFSHAVSATVPSPSPEIRDWCHLLTAELVNVAGRAATIFAVGEPWQVRFAFRAHRPIKQFNMDGRPVQTAWLPKLDLLPGDYHARFVQEEVSLAAGSYRLLVGLSEGERTIQQCEFARLDVTAENARGFLPLTSGVGLVLNSMKITLVPAPAGVSGTPT
jgi:lipopolysaccharide transport system ATP-binding protein